MHIRCPHCHSPIEVVDTDSLSDVSCPECGSNFSLIGAETITHVPGAASDLSGRARTIGHFELLEESRQRAFRHGVEGSRHKARPHRGRQNSAHGPDSKAQTPRCSFARPGRPPR